MKKCIAPALLALAAAGFCWKTTDLENDCGHRRIIFLRSGECRQTRSVTGHTPVGRLYPVALMWGELVPPVGKPKPSGEGNAWMCRAHAEEWRKVDE